LQQKQLQAASIVAALQTQEKAGPMNSKSCFFVNQTCRSYVSSETQQQQRKQTLSKVLYANP
jgi:hypothetical protein